MSTQNVDHSLIQQKPQPVSLTWGFFPPTRYPLSISDIRCILYLYETGRHKNKK